MVNLLTGPKGSGKTQQIIELANKKMKDCNGSVVLIKKSHRDTYSVDFNVRVICMTDYASISTVEEFVGFLYGMVASNHDIESIFIDGILKQANITLDNLSFFLEALNIFTQENHIEAFISISANREDIPNVDSADYNILN